MQRPKEPGQFEFDSFAANYAELLKDPIRERFADSSGFFFQRKVDVIRRFYRQRGLDTRTLTWLDVGCGQGEMLRLAHRDFKSAFGCDVSEGMLQACADLQVRRQPSPQEIPFDDHQVDFVTAVCVYHHVPEPLRGSFTAEILRVLKPGGIFCIIEHNPINPATRIIVSRTPIDADAHLLTARSTARMMAAAGTMVLETRYFLWFPQRVYQYLSGIEQALSTVPFGGQYAVFSSYPESAH
jgi:SAM-dependent methyltransferase